MNIPELCGVTFKSGLSVESVTFAELNVIRCRLGLQQNYSKETFRDTRYEISYLISQFARRFSMVFFRVIS